MAQEGAPTGLLEFVEKRLRARGRKVFAQCVDFGESGAQQPVGFFFVPSIVQLVKTSTDKSPPRRTKQVPF